MGKNSSPPGQYQGGGQQKSTHTGLDAIPGLGLVGDVFSGHDPVKGWGERMSKVPGIGGMFGGGDEPDAQALADRDTATNRPNVNTPFSSTGWTKDANGNWTMTQGAGSEAQGVYDNLKAHPFDLSGLGPVDTGAGARDQAITAAYDQATSRLNPQWNQRETQMRSQLANQGLDPNSQASRNANQTFSNARNDAYGGAMSSAIDKGQAAGDSVFRNSMMSRQQNIAEMLRQRGMPMEDLQSLKGLMSGGPDFKSGQGAAQLKLQQWAQQQGMNANDTQQLMSLLPFVL